jgi:hypothetical protein
MIPLGVRIAAFLSVPMVAATSASAEEKKKGAPPQSRQSSVMFAIDLPAQPVDATHALNLSAGVSNCKGSRGRLLS